MKLPGHNVWLLFYSPRWMPRAVWLYGRRWRILAWINLVVVCLISAAMLIGLLVEPDRIINCAWPFKLVPLAVVTIALVTNRCYKRRWMRSFYHRLKRLNCRVCWNCGYDLHGLPEAHVCPECSAAYDTAELVETWHEWIADVVHRRLVDLDED